MRVFGLRGRGDRPRLWLAAAAVVVLAQTPPRNLRSGDERSISALSRRRSRTSSSTTSRVTDDAVPATLIDLAARNVVDVEQRGPGVFYVRLRAARDEPLNTYERRVLDHCVPEPWTESCPPRR